MGWETRKGRRYFYSKQRIGGRVVSLYLGRGQDAHIADRLSALRGEAAKQRKARNDAELEALLADDRATDDLFEAASELMKAELLAEGFHQHDRTWRRKRDGESKAETTAKG